MNAGKITILATGGTFDKVYHDALSDYRIGEPQAAGILQRAGVEFEYHIEALIQKDSLDMDDGDRRRIKEMVEAGAGKYFVITHGTDTMVDTARALGTPTGKTVLLTGAMLPARFKDTDADFNLGFALGAVRLLPSGVYIVMNGEIFEPNNVLKDRAAGRFEAKV